VKLVLNLDKTSEYGSITRSDMVDDPNFNFQEFFMSMKSCIQYYNLDTKQTAAVNIICSSFMLPFLNDPTVTKFGSYAERENATKILLEKGAQSGLIMNLAGSGGSGKSFVLNATRSFCRQFCRAINCSCQKRIMHQIFTQTPHRGEGHCSAPL